METPWGQGRTAPVEALECAHRRDLLPGIERLQTQLVRYSSRGMSQNLLGSWSSKNCAVQPGVQVPEALRCSLVEAPAEWMLPLRTDKYIKPGFKLRVDVVHKQPVNVAVQVQAVVLTEKEYESILTWEPGSAAASDPAGQQAAGLLKGTLTKSHVIEATQVHPADAIGGLGGMGQQMWGLAAPSGDGGYDRTSAGKAPSLQELQELHAQRMRELSHGLGLPANSSLLARPGPPKPAQQVLANLPWSAQQQGEAAGALGGHPMVPQHVAEQSRSLSSHSGGGSESTPSTSVCSPALTGQGGSAGQQIGVQPLELPPGAAVTSHDFVFSDLRFTKPSRMSPVFILFYCTLPTTGDCLLTLFNVPTISTCRAEQWRPACIKLGFRADTPPPNSNRTPSNSVGVQPTQSIGMPAQSMGLGMGMGSGMSLPMPNPDPLAAGQFQQQQQLLMRQQQQHSQPQQSMYTGMQGSMGQQMPAQSMSVGMGMGQGSPYMGGVQQQNHEGELTAMLRGLGQGSGSGAVGSGAIGGLSQHSGGGGNGSLLHGRMPQAMHSGLQPMGQPSYGPGSAGGAAPSSAHYPQQPQQQQFLDSPLPGHEPSLAGLCDWIAEEYEATGLLRKLTQADMHALVGLAGMADPQILSIMPPAQLHMQLRQFVTQFRALLSLLKQLSGLWNGIAPCVVAGFEVGRDAATRALQNEPVGTFVCRLSMSASAGGLALAVKTMAGHPNAGPDSVMHVLITEADLQGRRAETLIRDFAGATHLLDVYTRKRVDKRKIFATNYMHLRKLEDAMGGSMVAVPPPGEGEAAVQPQAGLQGLPAAGQGLLPGLGAVAAAGAAAGVAAAAAAGGQQQAADNSSTLPPVLAAGLLAPGQEQGQGQGQGLLDALDTAAALMESGLGTLGTGALVGDSWVGMQSISDILLNSETFFD